MVWYLVSTPRSSLKLKLAAYTWITLPHKASHWKACLDWNTSVFTNIPTIAAEMHATTKYSKGQKICSASKNLSELDWTRREAFRGIQNSCPNLELLRVRFGGESTDQLKRFISRDYLVSIAPFTCKPRIETCYTKPESGALLYGARVVYQRNLGL